VYCYCGLFYREFSFTEAQNGLAMSDLEAASSPHAFLECWSDAIRTSSNRNGHQSQPKSAAVCVSGDSIEVLSTPSEFYETLCEEIEKSQKRISLASLYIGHAELEQKLLRTLRRKLQQQSNNVDLTDGHGSQFHLHILVDFARALRRLPQNNGHDRDPDSSEHARPDGVKQLGQASILWEHVFGHMNTADENQGNTVSAQVSLFRHPKFDTAAVLDRIPGSLKETVAVQHIKAYCFDDTVRFAEAFSRSPRTKYLHLRATMLFRSSSVVPICRTITLPIDKIGTS